MPESQRYTPEEFVAKLKTGDVAPPLWFLGILKPGADDQHLSFAIGTSCDSWTELPLELIESIEFIDVITCGDHAHPLVRLFVREPQSDEAMVFARLAKSQRPGRAQSPPPGGPGHGWPQPQAPRAWWPDRDYFPTRGVAPRLGGNTLVNASPESCAACWRFCRELTTTPDFDDFLWCLNFCGPLCPG